ncbi:hypothetical protein SLS58_006094 [Diplodia intermedia]|uniref:LAGLIDADG endonuclease n=1 Tax=Diplodia intermedia TaxID=856260 RepID=A0ABR3TPJ1_9PEZI
MASPTMIKLVKAMKDVFANHNTDYSNGYVNGETLKSFFGIWGSESIPDNWYRRHSIRPYSFQDLGNDIVYTFKQNLILIDVFFLGGNADGRMNNLKVLVLNEKVLPSSSCTCHPTTSTPQYSTV